MNNKRYIIALELSGSQIKGAAASVSTQTHASLVVPSIEAIAVEDKVNCVQYGRVLNVIDAAEHLGYVLQKLENDPALTRGKIISAYVALAGRSLGSVHTSAELTLNQEMQITDDILKRLCQEATKGIPAEKKVLKVLPRKYYIDNQISQKPVGTIGRKLRGEFTVITCSAVNRRNLETVMKDYMDLPVKGYVVTPLALASLVLGEEEKQLGCALVDIGAQTTTIAIYKDRALQYLATLPLGSQNITRDIAMGMNLTDERAELAKISQGNAIPEGEATSSEQKLVNCYVQARAGELVANIGAQIGFAGYKAADLGGGIVLTGRGSKLRNLGQLIQNQLKISTRLASIPATVNIAKRTFDPADYAPLISIIAHSAKVGDLESCVEFDESQPDDTASVTDENQTMQQEQTPSQNNGGYVAYDSDDPYVLMDDEQAAKRREQEARRLQREAEKKQQEAEKKRKAEEARAQKDAEAAEKAADKERRREEKRRKGSLLSRFTDTMTRLMTFNPEEDDSDLDDE
ncbi:MAG: pilus assembly protein PilM [Bacteroidales bacterium]|nr:pilus assembly protein PilM [Bacteroidales bacterium]